MPELPEVESVRLGLVTHTVGRTIVRAESRGARVTRHSPEGLGAVVGAKIGAVARRGKFLWFDLAESALVAHLGMSGQFRVDCEELPHVRARFFLDDGVRLDFIDQRTFGYLAPDRYITTGLSRDGRAERIPARVSHIARDLLDPLADREHLVAETLRKRSRIKTVLLDQSVVSGIGNIYADEALFDAEIHPETPACALTAERVDALYDAATAVLERALAAGGTSFDALYVQVNGESGYFDRSLRAYGRSGSPCERCGDTLKKIVVGGRSSTFCPTCQGQGSHISN